MTSPFYMVDAGEAFQLYIGTTIGRADDLYFLDGESALRHCADGCIETFDAELEYTGGQR